MSIPPTLHGSTNSFLLELPIELVESIAGYLDFEDVRNVQLTCKSLHGCTRTILLKAALSERSFLLADQHSMRKLEEISEHPVYRHLISNVRFSQATLQHADGDQFQRFVSSRRRPPTSQTRLEGRQQRKCYLDLIREETEFRGPECRRLLSKILINFMRAGKCPAIIATGTELQGTLKPWGYHRLAKMLGYADWTVDMKNDDSLGFAFVMGAVVTANYPVQRLEVGNVPQGVWRGAGVPPGWFRTAAFSSVDFSSLRTLKVTLSPEQGFRSGQQGYHPGREDYAEKMDDMTSFFLFLFQAPNIITLSITIDKHKTPQGLHGTLFHLLSDEKISREVAPRLRNLELVGHQIPIDSLYVFVQRRRVHLRNLSLARVREGGKDFSSTPSGSVFLRLGISQADPQARALGDG